MSCSIKGCREKAEYVQRGVSIILPGHPVPLVIGDLNVCPKHDKETRTGVRTAIKNDVITAALNRR